MFLSRDFCTEKLLPREVTIFLEKIKSFNILLKMQETNTYWQPVVLATALKIICLLSADAVF